MLLTRVTLVMAMLVLASALSYDAEPPTCEDMPGLAKGCKAWSAQGACENPGVMVQCPKTCRKCAEPSKCADLPGQELACKDLSEKGACRNPKVEVRCPKSCGKCADCPDSFEKMGNNLCLRLVQKRKTHQEARKACESLGGWLAEGATGVENDLITELIYKYYKDNKKNRGQVWLGATDVAKEGDWVWQHSGTKVNKSMFYKSPSNSGGNKNCLCTNRGGQWNDCPCHDRITYVCQQWAEPSKCADLPGHRVACKDWAEKGACGIPCVMEKCPKTCGICAEYQLPACPNGFKRYGLKCYKLGTQGNTRDHKSWHDAKTACTDMGAMLAEPKSEEQYKHMKSAIQGFGDVWFGGWKKPVKMIGPTWQWASDDAYISWFAWTNGNPTNRTDQNCMMYWAWRAGMDDAFCPTPRKFICEERTKCADLPGLSLACKAWSAQGACRNNSEVMEKCQETCGKCAESSSCADANSIQDKPGLERACKAWAVQGACQNPDVMVTCPKSCGKCAEFASDGNPTATSQFQHNFMGMVLFGTLTTLVNTMG